MAENINVTIRMDKVVKEDAENMFNGFGMNLSTAINIYVRQALRQGKIPFEIYDPFFSESNQAELNRRILDVNSGKNLKEHKLIEVIDE